MVGYLALEFGFLQLRSGSPELELERKILVQAVFGGMFSGEREAGEDWGKKLSKDVVSAGQESDPTGNTGA